jgi:hypothetical protein
MPCFPTMRWSEEIAIVTGMEALQIVGDLAGAEVVVLPLAIAPEAMSARWMLFKVASKGTQGAFS